MTEVLSGPAVAGFPLDPCSASLALFDDPMHVVVMTGDLDLASRDETVRACTAAGQVDVIVDMASLMFMDSAGYGALIAARTLLEFRGGSLTVVNPCGQPLRLMSLIGRSEGGPGI